MTKISRRSVLASVPLVGTGIDLWDSSNQEGLQRYSVGTTGSSGTEAAKESAERVIRVLNFNGEKESVTAVYTSQAVESLRQRDDIRYVEEDEEVPLPEPPEKETEQGTRTKSTETRSTQTPPEASTKTGEEDFYPWGMEQIGVDIVHQAGNKGEGVDIAIIDSGIDADHPDLPDLGGGRAIRPCTQTFCTAQWDDDLGHGTACAGVVGATDNGEFVTGVAPDSTIHAIKANNERDKYWKADTAAGIKWATDQGYDVINMSIGGSSPSPQRKEALEYAYENGVLLVASAGNEGECSDCVSFPAAHEEVIAVSATNPGDNLTSFSSTGPEVEMAAPGRNIRTLNPIPGPLAVFWQNGTSFAAPHVAGASALLMAQGYTNKEARQRLRETATDIGLSDNEQGYGRLDVEAAVIGKGINRIQILNREQNADGSLASFDVVISANTMTLEDYDTGSVGDPFFEIQINGESIVTTERVELDTNYEGSFTIGPDDLEQFSSGELTTTVILWEGDFFSDERIEEQTLTVDSSPQPVSSEIKILETNSPIEVGDRLTVRAEVENTGGESTTQEIGLIIEDEEMATETVTLDAGESTNVTLSYDTENEDIGPLDIAVSSKTGTDEGTVNIIRSETSTEKIDSPTSIEGTITNANPKDRYAFEVQAGRAIRFVGHIYDPDGPGRITLFDPSGSKILDMTNRGELTDDAPHGAVTEETGTHYVELSRVQKEFLGEVSYEFDLTTVEPDPSGENDDRENAIELMPGQTYQGYRAEDDEDWFAITVEDGDRITATLTFSVEEEWVALNDIGLELYGPDGQRAGELTRPENQTYMLSDTKTAEQRATAGETGTYYIYVTNESVEGYTAYDLTVETDGRSGEQQTITIDGRATDSRTDYEFTVSGNIEADEGVGSGDSISGSTATGFVQAGTDNYRFTGQIEEINLVGGDAVAFVDDEPITGSNDEVEPQHTIIIDGQGTDSRTDYEFTVPGNIRATGNIGTGDSISGSTATGFVRASKDTYRFTGDPDDIEFDLDEGDAVVFIDGQRVNDSSDN